MKQRTPMPRAASAGDRFLHAAVINRAGCALLLALCWLGSACSLAPPEPVPIVFIVVDTLRADRFDPPYAERTAPELSPWFARGRRFDRAFAPSPWTLPSVASLYTGRIPSRHGAGVGGHATPNGRFTRLRDEVPTLAERLRAAGYATGAVIGNAALAPEFGMDRGFDDYDYAPATNDFTRRADVVVNRALAWVDARESGDYFLVIHLFDPHMNYDAPPPFRGRFTRALRSDATLPVKDGNLLRANPAAVEPAMRRFIAAAYDEEVAFIDREVARLLAGLEARELLSRGLVFLLSDHGEELFEHGGFEHGHALWQEVVRLPFIVWGRDVVPGVDTTPVSLVDVEPTVAARVGLAERADGDGHSLWPRLRDEATLPDRTLVVEALLYGEEQKAVIQWPHKLVWSTAGDTQALYDLAADAGVTAPLARPATARALREAGELRMGRDRGSAAALAPETLRALRELGYAEPEHD